MTWQWVALGYFSYLAVVSMTLARFHRARRPLVIAATVAWLMFAITRAAGGFSTWGNPLLHALVPALVLLVGYWLSGWLFVQPDVRLEVWLRSVDDRVLARSGLSDWYGKAPRAMTACFELSYLLVYVVVPAGAATLVLAGRADQVDRLWTIVLLATFACYGMLPWLQTRPPRVLEEVIAPTTLRMPLVRRLNLAIANWASIQANTLPSGHTAGAFATALAVGSTMPAAGAAFMVLATTIAAATVLGRYHYVVDAVLGILIAVAAWMLV